MISKGWTFLESLNLNFMLEIAVFFVFRKKSTPCVMTSGKLSNSHGKNISCRCRRHVKIISFNGSVQQTTQLPPNLLHLKETENEPMPLSLWSRWRCERALREKFILIENPLESTSFRSEQFNEKVSLSYTQKAFNRCSLWAEGYKRRVSRMSTGNCNENCWFQNELF